MSNNKQDSNFEKISKELHQVLSCFLNYSFKDIDFKYESLTPKEKSFCTEKQFKELVEKFCSK